jgi:hypothetical protein
MLRNPQAYRPISKKQRRAVRTQMLTVRRFQYYYALFLVTFGAIMSLVVGGITLYILNHNYELLAKAQLLTAPRLVDNLLHEQRLANEVIVGSYVAFVAFLGFVGVKFSHSIAVPVYLIQEKMRDICRGDLTNANVRIRKTDEFQEFAETYNYLVDVLKSQAKSDVERLLQLKPDHHNRDAVHSWQLMLHEKNAQLNGNEFSSTDPADVSRHAS